MLKRIIVLLSIILLIVPSFTGMGEKTVHAGAAGSASTPEGGGGSIGKGHFRTPLKWIIKRDIPETVIIRDTHVTPNHLIKIPATDSLAYITLSRYDRGGGAVGYPNNWYRWEEWMKEGHGNPGGSYNKQLWDPNKILPNDFRQEVKAHGFSTVKAGALYKKGDLYADVIWLNAPNIKKSEKTKKNVIVAVSHNGVDSNDFNNKDKSAEWLYGNPKESQIFSYKSKENEYKYNHSIKVTTSTVTKLTRWEEDRKGNKSNIKNTYSTGNQKTKTVGANWSADIPDLTFKPFKPLDLATGEAATKEILNKSKDYRHNQFTDSSIIADLDNGKGSGSMDTDGVRLIDTNEPKEFSVKFNNDQLGIPSKSQGGVDVSKDKPDYSPSLDGVQIFWGPKITIASSTVSSNPDLTSIEYDGKEYKGRDTIDESYGWRGSDFKYRTIKQGSYYLSDGSSNPFWNSEIMTGKYFSYGSEYSTEVKATASGPSFTNLEGTKVKTVETKQWTGFIDKKVKQPILYGEFESRTVGGHKRN